MTWTPKLLSKSNDTGRWEFTVAYAEDVTGKIVTRKYIVPVLDDAVIEKMASAEIKCLDAMRAAESKLTYADGIAIRPEPPPVELPPDPNILTDEEIDEIYRLYSVGDAAWKKALDTNFAKLSNQAKLANVKK